MDIQRVSGSGCPSEGAIVWPLWFAIAVIACISAQPYLYGYRLSGDDIWFLMLGIEGWDSVRDNAIAVARDQGRIGQLLMVPLNVVGSIVAGNLLGRVAILLAYGLQLLLFAVFVARLLRRDVHPFLFLLLVALHPLAFAFMPPNAYPLQNTVPFIIILSARLILLGERRLHDPFRLQTAAAQAGIVVGMFVSEFAIAFGAALLAADYLARIQWAREVDGRSPGDAFRSAFQLRYLIADGLSLLSVIVAYGVFRWAYPGNYEGNAPGGLFEPGRVVLTLLGHIRDGTAFPRLGGGFSSAGVADIALAVMIGAAVAVTLFRSAGPVLRMGTPVACGAAALALAILVSLPVAISAKYQEACVDRGACAYLDSRMSYLMVMVAVTAVVAIACRSTPTHPARRYVLTVICAALGLMAGLVSIYNAAKGRDMQEVHAVWQRADALACSRTAQLEDEATLQATIDPQGLVAVNPPNRAADFWKVYIPWRSGHQCR